eukprot:TRINITY_DN2547_c0_g1_i1.p2 TRINITY_DN2547_c0_g1~~TRINITY_DN2547_c0_g1_i1.p2  ORF type:complete len:152 (-),score=26.02 TRINITY_DN2547_c0_g1_i1:46-501(-)
MADIPLPRNFKLLAEYDASIGKAGVEPLIKGEHNMFIQYGADDTKDDILLHYWQGMIFGPQGKQTGELMYNFTAYCSDNYPQEPPKIRFQGPKMAMKAVDNQGNVDLSKLVPAFKWTANMNIADALMAIRSNMSDSTVANQSYPLRNQNYY